MKKVRVIGLIVSGLLLLSIAAQAYTIVTAAPGTTQYIQNVSEVANGPDMAGMVVHVEGANGVGAPFSNTGTWFTPFLASPLYGGASFNGRRLSLLSVPSRRHLHQLLSALLLL